MNSVSLEPSARTFAHIYEGRTKRRLTRKSLAVAGLTVACYSVLGYYFINQKYELIPYVEPAEPNAVVVESWRLDPPPPTPVEQKTQAARAPVPARQAATAVATEQTLPLTPVETPSEGLPTTFEPVAPVAAPDLTEPAAASATPSIIRNPVWISRPTPEQVGRLYPERAAARGLSGSATLLCGVRANGGMTDCQVIEESPTGAGFGKAALSMARYFRISPKTVDGVLVEGSRVRIPVAFSLAE